MTAPVLLAAYGTLMSGQRCGLDPAMRARMRLGRPCRIPGRLYAIPGPDGRPAFPALVPCPGDGGASVRGEAFEIGADDAEAAIVLAATDRWEECVPDDPDASTYVRRRCPVLVEGIARQAWLYLYNRPIDRLRPITNGSWCDRPDSRG